MTQDSSQGSNTPAQGNVNTSGITDEPLAGAGQSGNVGTDPHNVPVDSSTLASGTVPPSEGDSDK